MSEVYLTNNGNGLVPSTAQDSEALGVLKLGEQVRARITRPRNLLFHRKFFAMLNVGFDAFTPLVTEYQGHPVQKNFERFRQDVIIAAGYYDIVPAINGEARAIAKSISFGKMPEGEFQELYSRVADVLLQRILKNYNREDLDRVVDDILGFC